jgi:hypothetical protein
LPSLMQIAEKCACTQFVMSKEEAKRLKRDEFRKEKKNSN